MHDRWSVALAASALLGATRPSGVPLLVGAVVVAAALLVRRPALLCLGTALLVSSLAARSLAGLDGVVPGPIDAEVTLLSDPAPTAGGLRADVRIGGRRLELVAAGSVAESLRGLLAAERAHVRGALEPVPRDAPWLTSRHVAGRLRVHAVLSTRPGGVVGRSANALRRTLVRGAAPFSPAQRALYTGLVIGDDREQSVGLADDFRGAGLTHLLAVSGQNVAFVLALAGPLLRRLRIWPRFLVTLAVIGMFGLLTRFEPSVLRATAMAALAATISTAGLPVSRLRVLALAVTGLVVIDPLLVRSVGFQLSAAAAGAIVVLAPRLASALPGPVPLRDALAVTLAAQLGVAPVLLATFGPVPVASLPANLLAVPVAGLVMVWGLTAGLLAGVGGAPVAALVHLPTRVLLLWLTEVAARASRLPLGSLDAVHLALLGAGSLAAVGGRAARREVVRLGGLAIAGAALSTAVLSMQAAAALRTDLVPGLVRWHHGPTDVVVLGGAGGRSTLSAAAALSSLREAGVRSIDLLVVADLSVPAGVVPVIEARHPLGAIVTMSGADVGPVAAQVRAAPRPGEVIQVGALEVHLTTTASRLVVEAVPGTG